MTLNNCTKKELISIIKQLTWLNDSHLKTILISVEYERVKEKIKKAEHYSEIADSNREKYIEFLKKYSGSKVTDIPTDEIEQAEQHLKAAEKADKEYNKLMKEVDAYGSFDKKVVKK